MSWTLPAFNFITGFLWAYDAKLEWRSYLTSSC
jgi:hypothetical protein